MKKTCVWFSPLTQAVHNCLQLSQSICCPLLFSTGTHTPYTHSHPHARTSAGTRAHTHACTYTSSFAMSLSYSLLAFSLTLSADRTHSLVLVNWLQSSKVQFAAPQRRLPVYYSPVSPVLSPSIKVFGALKALK